MLSGLLNEEKALVSYLYCVDLSQLQDQYFQDIGVPKNWWIPRY